MGGSSSGPAGYMGPTGAGRRVVGDPVAPRVDTALVGNSGARAVAYLVNLGRGTGQDGQLRRWRGADVGAVQGSVHLQGSRETRGTLGQFLVCFGSNPTFAGELGAFDDLSGSEEHPTRRALRTAHQQDLVELVDLAEETGVRLAAAQAQGRLRADSPASRDASRSSEPTSSKRLRLRRTAWLSGSVGTPRPLDHRRGRSGAASRGLCSRLPEDQPG